MRDAMVGGNKREFVSLWILFEGQPDNTIPIPSEIFPFFFIFADQREIIKNSNYSMLFDYSCGVGEKQLGGGKFCLVC